MFQELLIFFKHPNTYTYLKTVSSRSQLEQERELNVLVEKGTDISEFLKKFSLMVTHFSIRNESF